MALVAGAKCGSEEAIADRIETRHPPAAPVPPAPLGAERDDDDYGEAEQQQKLSHAQGEEHAWAAVLMRPCANDGPPQETL